MANTEADNYVRCHQAVQLACAKAIPSIQYVLKHWHHSLRVKLKPCISPKTCPTKGKPKPTRGSCSTCVDWGNELESVVYPPNSSGASPWSNINPTLLYADPIEAAKLFVLRLQPGVVYTDVGDFDAASLIMIMMKFSEFHQGDIRVYNAIKKVADIRNHLSHIKVNTNLLLDDNETDRYFQDLRDFITCLSKTHACSFPQATAHQSLQTLQEIRMDTLDIDVCHKELIRVYEEEKGMLTLFPFDVDSTVDIDDVYVELILERDNNVTLNSFDELFSLQKRQGQDTPVLRVLLKGKAGTGKTTLARKIAYDWAQCVKGNLGKVRSPLRKFTLLFSLQMRNFDRDMSLVDAVFDQLLPSDSIVSKRGLQKYIVANADKVAIILDGADEYKGKVERSSVGNLIMDVVCNKMLCDSCVVVTTRPHVLTNVKEFSQYGQVCLKGFDEASVLKFIGKFFQVSTYQSVKELHEALGLHGKLKPVTGQWGAFKRDMEFEFGLKTDNATDGNDEPLSGLEEGSLCDEKSVEKFIKTVYRSPFLLPMVCVPVLLTMLCLLWKGAQRLPASLTTLYEEISHYFIQRWLEKSNTEIDYDDTEARLMSTLGQVAATCVKDNRLIFNATETKDTEVLAKSCAIGIVVKEIRRSRLHLVRQYVFFHRSFQEFYAAVHLVAQLETSSGKFMQFLDDIDSAHLDHMENVLSFCCGLSADAARLILSRLVHLRLNKVVQGQCSRFDMFHDDSWALGMRFLFESQNSELAQILTKWLVCDEVEIIINTYGYNRELERDSTFDFFITSLENHAGKEGTYSVISAEVINTQRDDFAEDYGDEDLNRLNRIARLGQWKTCSHGLSTIINLLLGYSKHQVTLKLDIVSDFDKSLNIAAATLKQITQPFNELNITFTRHDHWLIFPTLPRPDPDYYLPLMKLGLRSLGISIGQLHFSFRLRLVHSEGLPLDISPLLDFIVTVSTPLLINEFHTNCVFEERSFERFILTSTDLSNLVILPPDVSDFNLVMIMLQGLQISPFKTVSLEAFLSLVLRIPTLATLWLWLYGATLGNAEMQVAELFFQLQDLTLLAGDGILWKSVFSILRARMITRPITVRNLCLGQTRIGGDTITVSNSPIYLVNDDTRREHSPQLQRSFSGPFLWLSKALEIQYRGSRIQITSAIDDLSRVLPSMLSLESLDLSSTSLVPGDVENLAGSLSACSHLKALNLSRNSVNDSSLCLVRSLLKVVGLTELKLANTNLSNTALLHLGMSMRNLQELRNLDLSGNQIRFKVCHELSQGLQHLHQLRQLDMSGNPVGDMGVLALCAAFPRLSRLEYLGLENCEFTSTGLLLLSLSFPFIPYLKRLNLARNISLGPDGVTWLFEGIHYLKELNELHLDGVELDRVKCGTRLQKVFETLEWEAGDTDIEHDQQPIYKMQLMKSGEIAKIVTEFSTT